MEEKRRFQMADAEAAAESGKDLFDAERINSLSNLELTPQEDKALLRRIDLRLVPISSVLYLLSFLDRVNIGQAKTAGLAKDLNLSSNEYNIALTLFFVSYVAFEIPSNLVLKHFKPHRYITVIMLIWGIIMTFMGFATGFGSLSAIRFLLGIAESGLFPGLNFLFTTWYKRTEQSKRISFFFAGATLAGAFGGLLAYGIRHMDGVGGKAGWSWIFILEGLLTIVVAPLTYFLLPDFPEDGKILNEKETAQWQHRLRKDQGLSNAVLPFSWSQVIRGFTDWKVYVYSLLYISIAEPFYSLSLFTPTILVELGYSGATANLLTIPPYVLGFITTMATAWISDRWAVRGPFLMFYMLVTCVGYIILLCDVSVGVKYFCLFLTVAATSPSIATAITWIGNNCGPFYTRATAMAIFFSCGNSAGIISSNVYPSKTAPRFIEGHAVALGFAATAVICAAILTFANYRENARRDRVYGPSDSTGLSAALALSPEQKQKYGYEHLSDEEILELGDRHGAYRYIL